MFNLNQVDNWCPPRSPSKLRNLISLDPVYLALIGKEHQVIVGVAHKEMFHEVLVFGIHPHNTAASALLAAIGADWQTFDVASMRNGDDNLFTRNQILIEDAFFPNRDFRTAVIRISIPDLLEFVTDNLQHQMLISQNLTVFSYLGQQLIIFVLNFFTFQAGQTLHPHIKDSLCLLYAETECAHQAIPCDISRTGGTD
ncbi:hypothetical protein D3C75_879970 [compost metagenome]